MKYKKVVMGSTILIATIALFFLIIFNMNTKKTSDYVFEMEYRLADFSDGIDRQRKILDEVDLNRIDTVGESRLVFFPGPYATLLLKMNGMEEPIEKDLQEFHEDFTNLTSDYWHTSQNFIDSAKKRDVDSFNISEKEMVVLIKRYNEIYDRLEQLKQKYY